MTIEIVEFRCPTCGHQLGEKEYEHACSEFNSRVQAAWEEQKEKLNDLHKKEMNEKEKTHRQELQQQEQRYDKEIENKVSQEVRSRLVDYEEKSKNEKAQMIKEHEQELRRKDEELNAVKLQNTEQIEEMIREAVRRNDDDHKLREVEHDLHISRIEKENERMQKILENVPPEFRGTTGELKLFDDLREAFKQDDLVIKKVGVEMPDVIQTIVTQSGEKIPNPILWDRKMGESITTKDIEKAKRYKEKYNTDTCIIVTTKRISAKDSKNRREGLIGKRDGILLVHHSLAVGIAEETRSCIIEKTRLVKNNNGRGSKETKLYDYITSPLRFRKIQKKLENRLKLEELIRKQEDYNKKAWNEQKKKIKECFDLDKDDQGSIDSMTEKEELDGEGNTSGDDEGDDVT